MVVWGDTNYFEEDLKSLNREKLIIKTILKERGYKYQAYETKFYKRGNDEIIELYHYGTLILRVNLTKRIVEEYYIYSYSDQETISLTISTIDEQYPFKYKYFAQWWYLWISEFYLPLPQNKHLTMESYNKLIEFSRKYKEIFENLNTRRNLSKLYQLSELVLSNLETKEEQIRGIMERLKINSMISEKLKERYLRENDIYNKNLFVFGDRIFIVFWDWSIEIRNNGTMHVYLFDYPILMFPFKKALANGKIMKSKYIEKKEISFNDLTNYDKERIIRILKENKDIYPLCGKILVKFMLLQKI